MFKKKETKNCIQNNIIQFMNLDNAIQITRPIKCVTKCLEYSTFIAFKESIPRKYLLGN